MPFVPIVAIELPAEIAPDLATVTLRACNLALGTGRCALVENTGSPQGNAWVATVRFDPAQPNLFRIDLRDAAPQSTLTSFTRTLTFDGTEPLPHRWSTAGVVVAALVISAQSSARTEPAPSGSTSLDATAKSVTASNRPKKQNRGEETSDNSDPGGRKTAEGDVKLGQRDVRLDFGGLAGSSLQSGVMRWGGMLRPSVELGQSVFAWTSLSAAASDDAVKAFWWSGAVGLGFASTARNRRFGVEGRLGFKGERVSFTTTEAGIEDHGARTRWGGVAGVDLSLGISRPLALWLGGEAEALFPRVNVTVGGQDQGQLSTLNGSVAVGFRLRFGFDSR